MLFLEVKFYAKADIAGSRLHKVVIALVIVRLGGGGSFRVERSFGKTASSLLMMTPIGGCGFLLMGLSVQ